MHTTFKHCHTADRQVTTWVQTSHLLSACPELKEALSQEMLSTLRGCFSILWSTMPILRSFLTFWSFWQGTHSHSLRKQSPGNRLWWEEQSSGGPAWCTGTLRPPRVAQWTRLTGKLPNGGWWSDTQHLTLGWLHNKEIASLFSFTSLWGLSNCYKKY